MDTQFTTSQDGSHSMAHHYAEEDAKYFTFFNLSIALIALTGIELVIVYLPFAPWFVMFSLLAMSGFKFLAVIWWFMHLRWDKVLCTGLFFSGIVIATGTVTALMFLFEKAPGGVPAGF